nr:unnamed protein product [Callosobruchus analis]
MGYLVDIFKIVRRPLRVSLLLVVIYWNFFLSFAMWDAYTVGNWHSVLPQILTLLVLEYDCTSLLMAVFLYDDFLFMYDLLKKTFRPILTTDPILGRRIARRRIICYVQLTTLTLTSILMHYVGVTPMPGDEDGYLYHRLYVRRFFGYNSIAVVLQFIVFYTVISIMTLGSFVQVTICMYSALQINFQNHLLVDDLNTNLMSYQESFSLVDDHSYQEKVSNSLKRCVEDLLKIQAVATKFIKLQSPVVLVSATSGGMVVLVLLYMLMEVREMLQDTGCCGDHFGILHMVVTFCHLGQEYSDAISRLRYSIFCVARKVK